MLTKPHLKISVFVHVCSLHMTQGSQALRDFKILKQKRNMIC
jgi:hypothetical protein